MLTRLFDLTIATYPNRTAFDPTEASTADLIQFGEYVPGGIYHPVKMCWRLFLNEFTEFEQTVESNRERKALRENAQWVKDNGFQFYQVPVGDTEFAKFYELYQRTTLTKDRGIDYVRPEIVKEQQAAGHEVFLLGFAKDGHYVSSHFCFIEKGMLKLAYSAIEHLPELRGGLGGLIHPEIFRIAKEKGLKAISHGSGMNPMGLTSSAGLFEFKARYGYSAYPMEEWVTTFIRTPKACAKSLVFLTIADNQLAQKVISAEQLPGLQVYSTPKVPAVAWVSLADAISSGSQLLSA